MDLRIESLARHDFCRTFFHIGQSLKAWLIVSFGWRQVGQTCVVASFAV